MENKYNIKINIKLFSMNKYMYSVLSIIYQQCNVFIESEDIQSYYTDLDNDELTIDIDVTDDKFNYVSSILYTLFNTMVINESIKSYETEITRINIF